MIRKIENGIAVVLVLVLAVLPLLMKLVQEGLHVPVSGADAAQVNLVFLFSCVAGIITWREDKHLSLASLTDRAPETFRQIVMRDRTSTVIAALTAFFFTAFSESFTIFTPLDKVWGVPLSIIFIALPLMYFAMLVMACHRAKHRAAAVVGLCIGLYVSMGPITGVLYSIFGFDNLNFLYTLTDSWLSFSSLAFVPLVILMIFLALMGVPLFVVIGAIAYIAFSQGGGYVEVTALEAYNILTDKSIAAIPLFTIAGYILAHGSAGERLVDIFKTGFGWFRGGAVVASVIVATFFTTFTGVSGVTILALGGLLTMVLTGTGYTKDKAQSLVTSSGAIGLLFPPSVAIIMYGKTN